MRRAAVNAARRSFRGGVEYLPYRASLASLQAVHAWTTTSHQNTYATFALSCGNGDFGRLGHGGSGSGESALGLTTDRFTKIKVPVDVAGVSAGGAHTALVGTDGSVYTCGLNDFGQLGVSSEISHLCVPTIVEGLPEHDPVVAVAAGHFHTLCLTKNGEVWSFGRNDEGQCGVGGGGDGGVPNIITSPAWVENLSPHSLGGADRGRVVAIAAGQRHSMAVTENGAVFTWGSTFEGCLGHGGDDDVGGSGNSYGLLGGIADSFKRFVTSKKGMQPTPQLIRALADSKITGLVPSVGLAHSLLLDNSGTMHVWGQGRFNQLGVGARMNVAWVETPASIKFSTKNEKENKENKKSTDTNTLEGCLGHGGDDDVGGSGNSYGLLGGIADSFKRFVTSKKGMQPTPQLIRALADSKITGLVPSVGLAHSLLLDNSGTMHVWGQGRFNQLGVGARMNVAWVETPASIKFSTKNEKENKENKKSTDTNTPVPPNTTVKSLAAGGNFSVAVTETGKLISWGANGNGECGGGAEDDGRRDRPRYVKHPRDKKRPVVFENVSAGWRHACAVTTDGRVFSWGWGGSAGQHSDDAFTTGGQLGLGDGQCDFWEPTVVPGVGNPGRVDAVFAKNVSCGFNHTVLIVSDD